MIILGLTGSIGMGKSTVAQQFRRCGVTVCDSDDIVHRLLAPKGEAVSRVAEIFAGTRKGDGIDRALLGKEVFGNNAKLKKLEAILHPLVYAAQARFIKRARVLKKQIVVLDIPVLFETKGEERCHYTIVASAPHFIQKQRVFKRSGMTEEKLMKILSHQMKDSEKRRCADFIVPTGLGKYVSLKAVKQILSVLKR